AEIILHIKRLLRPRRPENEVSCLAPPASIRSDRPFVTHAQSEGFMKFPRRRFLHLAAGAAVLPELSRIAEAQAYPSRPVRIVVGFGSGSAFDILARLIGQWLSDRLGQPFVIENRGGAGGVLGAEAVVRAPADGYTLLLGGSPDAINATLYDKLNF